MGRPIKAHKCRNCGETDPKKFYTRSKGLCKKCYYITQRDAPSRRIPGRNLIYKYGITFSQFKQMVDEQGGVCANPACNRDAEYVDHDHETGLIRGILCHNCNSAIGLAREDWEILKGLVDYLLE